MKQGHWVYTNKIKKLPNYNENQVVEEGQLLWTIKKLANGFLLQQQQSKASFNLLK